MKDVDSGLEGPSTLGEPRVQLHARASGVHDDTNSSDVLPSGIAHSFLGRVSPNMSFALLHIVS